MDDRPAVRRALQAVARRRAMGLHYIGHFLGIEPASHDEDGTVRMRIIPWDSAGEESMTAADLGTLADLTMGQAIRNRLPEGLRLATTSLDLHHGPDPARGGVTSSASVHWLDERRQTATASCEVTDAAGTVVATASGAFSALPAPPGASIAPVDWSWLRVGVPEVADGNLNRSDAGFVAAVRAAVDSASSEPGAPPVDPERTRVIGHLLNVRWKSIENGSVRGEFRVGPEHENRVGHLQGGVVYGLGAVAARHVLGNQCRVVDGRVQFLRPTGHGQVSITATVLRHGRSVSFVRVQLASDGRQTTEMTFTLAPDHNGL
ncbi:hypothetical protein GCM10010121_062690 [Streptomyces brasiliensis]|uniref:Acyl-CoA thioesterase-like N-terminal HotDog domain-containing protein n=1 Tax=Streptomyces brasiliensis TaxID=1954 RepID=A0A917P0T3_9ACTN|nr:hypothetical protein GCM10010121_062690 [Streptomyces brasiliensis]